MNPQLCTSSSFLLKPALLSDLTTWKIGGATKVFEPTSIGQIQRFLNQYTGRVAVLGYGSNILAPSQGFEGVCLVLKKNFSRYRLFGPYLTALAGLSCPKLAKLAQRQGYSSLNFLMGIPGSIGGAVVMNAGCHGREILSHVERLTMVDRQGKVYQLRRDELRWQYRKTFFPLEGIVTSVTFDLRGSFPLSLKEVIGHRTKTQPLRLPSCGSCFKNPAPAFPAGKLIEDLGLKGMRYQGLEISPKHANFMINQHGALSADVLSLTNFIQKKVFLTTGLILEPEYQLLRPLDSYAPQTLL